MPENTDIRYRVEASESANPAAAMIALWQFFRFDRAAQPSRGAVGDHAGEIYRLIKARSVDLFTDPARLVEVAEASGIGRLSGTPAEIAVGMGEVFNHLGLPPQYLKFVGESRWGEEQKQTDECFGFALPTKDPWVLAPGFSAPLALPIDSEYHKIIGLSPEIRPFPFVDNYGKEAKRISFFTKYVAMLISTRVRATLLDFGEVLIENENIEKVVHRKMRGKKTNIESILDARLDFTRNQKYASSTSRQFQVDVRKCGGTHMCMSEG